MPGSGFLIRLFQWLEWISGMVVKVLDTLFLWWTR